MRKKFAINTKCATTFGTDFSFDDLLIENGMEFYKIVEL